jgi:hypothetical protein
MEQQLRGLGAADAAAVQTRQAALEAVGVLARATHALLTTLSTRADAGMAVSVPYLKLCGYVIAGWLMARAADLAARKLEGAEREFYAAKLRTAAFYAAQVLPTAVALARVVEAGGASVVETDAALI